MIAVLLSHAAELRPHFLRAAEGAMVFGVNRVKVKRPQQFHRRSAGHPGHGFGTLRIAGKEIVAGHDFLQPCAGLERRTEVRVGLP